jgi:hypothetical protein
MAMRGGLVEGKSMMWALENFKQYRTQAVKGIVPVLAFPGE